MGHVRQHLDAYKVVILFSLCYSQAESYMVENTYVYVHVHIYMYVIGIHVHVCWHLNAYTIVYSH